MKNLFFISGRLKATCGFRRKYRADYIEIRRMQYSGVRGKLPCNGYAMVMRGEGVHFSLPSYSAPESGGRGNENL